MCYYGLGYAGSRHPPCGVYELKVNVNINISRNQFAVTTYFRAPRETERGYDPSRFTFLPF